MVRKPKATEVVDDPKPSKKAARAKETLVIEVPEITMQVVRMNLMGSSPMIMNRFAQKAWQNLILPAPRANRAGLEAKLKHDPLAEYRGAFYRNRNEDEPTLFHCPNKAFHAAISDVALDLPGPKKAQLERLTQVIDISINLYGVPQIFCAMVRNSDIGRTPDVRTRPIFPTWGCTITVQYLKGSLTERSVLSLAHAAGLLRGIGDWRPQKGGPYGRFKLVADNDPEFKELKKLGGRKAQLQAYENPAYFDLDTQDILTWFAEEVKRREMEGQLVGAADDELELPDVSIIEEIGGGGQRGDAGRYEGKNGRRGA